MRKFEQAMNELAELGKTSNSATEFAAAIISACEEFGTEAVATALMDREVFKQS